ncbi:hypothetical protein JK358_35680 [Nocardia sp. 2]|uniref:PPE family domain-containing protein n=1 Tax=Nocardia acididurans TaxID=2802282 RepID=A0ABS1MGG7_9NOCA|nr:type VII secretion target [Nocardia acididurans]MBL1079756.1 hypothetical protein [Nocardia acididurans]
MNLHVSPDDLDGIATSMAATARELARTTPRQWFRGAGTDDGSRAMGEWTNHHLAAIKQTIENCCNAIQDTHDKLRIAAAEYRRADAQGAAALGAPGGDTSARPVALPPLSVPTTPPPRQASQQANLTSEALARQLNNGPGPEHARQLAADLRAFRSGPQQDADNGLRGLQQRLPDAWRPNGAGAAAEVSRHRDSLDRVGTRLDALATALDRYRQAFLTAQNTHPKPGEIQQAWEELQAALRGKDDLAVQQALDRYNELRERSLRTADNYFSEVGDSTTATNKPGDQPEDEKPPANTGSTGSDSMTSMLPLLLNSLASNALSSDSESALDDAYYDDELLDDYLPAYDTSGYAGGGGGYYGSPGTTVSGAATGSSVPFGTLPVTANTAAVAATSGPRAPVLDAYNPNAATSTNPTRAGSGYMPGYFPPGMAGAGANGNGNDRPRVKEWHPDRLMYEDKTQSVEQVIGDKPTIRPTVTPPTPATSPTGATP